MINDFPEIPMVSKAEFVAAVAARGGDDEKVATTPLTVLNYRGVSISSRYQKAKGMEVMVRMVHALGIDATLVETLFCDSKAQANYSVRMHSGERVDAWRVAEQLDQFLLENYGGHNGVYVEGAAGEAHANPNWREPPVDYSEVEGGDDDLSF